MLNDAAMEVDLFDPRTQEDWYPTYAWLRENQPVYQIPGTRLYVLTRYEDIAAVVRNSELFSNQAELHGGEPLLLHAEARSIYQERGWARAFPLAVDPPNHRKYRSLVDPLLMGERLRTLQPMIKQLVHELIDGLQERGEIEFIEAFAIPLPVAVIGKILGFPQEDTAQLRIWSAAWAAPFARGLTREQEISVAELGVEFQHYIKSHIDDRRRTPRDDVISHLVQVRLDGRPLADGEIIQMIDHLYIGGNETTTFALTSGMWLMLREPRVYEQLKAEPGKLRTFVEEVLRLESPTQGLYRTATRDTEIRGVPIPQGATIHIRFGAGNRDADVFADPDRLDLDRQNASRHLAFSQSEHHCPGFSLSKLEQFLSFQALIERLPNLRFTSGRNDFKHLPGFVLRSLRELNLSFDATVAAS
jgi:cytochrome P450